MRGKKPPQQSMLALVSPDSLVPQDHPIRRVRQLVQPVLKDLDPVFDAMYADKGRLPSCSFPGRCTQAPG